MKHISIEKLATSLIESALNHLDTIKEDDRVDAARKNLMCAIETLSFLKQNEEASDDPR